MADQVFYQHWKTLESTSETNYQRVLSGPNSGLLHFGDFKHHSLRTHASFYEVIKSEHSGVICDASEANRYNRSSVCRATDKARKSVITH